MNVNRSFFSSTHGEDDVALAYEWPWPIHVLERYVIYKLMHNLLYHILSRLYICIRNKKSWFLQVWSELCGVAKPLRKTEKNPTQWIMNTHLYKTKFVRISSINFHCQTSFYFWLSITKKLTTCNRISIPLIAQNYIYCRYMYSADFNII